MVKTKKIGGKNWVVYKTFTTVAKAKHFAKFKLKGFRQYRVVGRNVYVKA